MSRQITVLDPDFQPIVTNVLSECKAQGVVMVPFFTLRTPIEQARLWRQSRSWKEIKQAIDHLKNDGAPWLADVLQNAGPQHGKWATNALPGESWHNWGFAVDCFLLVDGYAVWNADHKGYRIYAEVATEYNLIAGYCWKSRDAVHIQYYQQSVRKSHEWPHINARMKEMFGG